MSANVPPAKRPKRAATKKTASQPPKSTVQADQPHVCSEFGCAKAYGSARGLAAHRRVAHPAPPAPAPIESPSVALACRSTYTARIASAVVSYEVESR